jgi:hypothetical protein
MAPAQLWALGGASAAAGTGAAIIAAVIAAVVNQRLCASYLRPPVLRAAMGTHPAEHPGDTGSIRTRERTQGCTVGIGPTTVWTVCLTVDDR